MKIGKYLGRGGLNGKGSIENGDVREQGRLRVLTRPVRL